MRKIISRKTIHYWEAKEAREVIRVVVKNKVRINEVIRGPSTPRSQAKWPSTVGPSIVGPTIG